MEKNNQPLVSIVIPCYNHENFVQDCIQSVIDQTYENIELIIIDDGSKDHSVERIQKMVQKCKERFVRFEFRSRPNKGLSATLNEAIKWCKGGYFSIIASDDLMIENKTKIQVEYLEDNFNIVAIFGNVNLINDNNEIIKTESYASRFYNFDTILLNKHHINACTQMIRTKAIIDVGGYKAGITIEDLYMWLKLSQYGELYVDQQVFSNYRLHEDNSIKKGEFIYKGCLDVIAEYHYHPLFLKAMKKIIWTYTVYLALSDKNKSKKFLKNILLSNLIDIFSKDFIRYIRNYYFR